MVSWYVRVHDVLRNPWLCRFEAFRGLAATLPLLAQHHNGEKI